MTKNKSFFGNDKYVYALELKAYKRRPNYKTCTTIYLPLFSYAPDLSNTILRLKLNISMNQEENQRPYTQTSSVSSLMLLWSTAIFYCARKEWPLRSVADSHCAGRGRINPIWLNKKHHNHRFSIILEGLICTFSLLITLSFTFQTSKFWNQ